MKVLPKNMVKYSLMGTLKIQVSPVCHRGNSRSMSALLVMAESLVPDSEVRF